MKKAIIAGGTGHIGSSLADRLVREGYEVKVLTRNSPNHREANRYVVWDGQNHGEWIHELDGADVLVNLCGKSVDCRYTEANKRALIDSRVNTTVLLGEAIAKCKRPPKVWVNSSSSAYYGFSTEVVTEYNGPGHDFPATICVKWEDAFFSAHAPVTRKVAWRTGVVLQPKKGLILPFVGLVKAFFGGKLGTGNQYFTWIHEEDFLKAALWTIENASAEGSYNITSPEPVTNAVFMEGLRKALKIPVGISLPSWLIQIGGKIVGTEPYLVLDGRRVVPERLMIAGFQFQFADINNSLGNLFR